MWPFSSKTRSRVAVVLHDGATWHAHVFAPAKPEWRPMARMTLASRAPGKLPEAVLEFAEKHGARRVRLALPRNIHTLRTELPVDAEPEELQTAMAFELSSETGDAVEGVRVAAALGESFAMGAAPATLLAASFDEEPLERYAAACRNAGLRFDGAGSLELAVLGVHAEACPNARLLFIRRDAAFYAVPGTDLSPMTVGPVPMGMEDAQQEMDAERGERLRRRLGLQQALPVAVWCVGVPDGGRKERIQDLLGETADVEFRDFELATEQVARQLLGAVEAGMPAGAGARVGARPPEKDPHRAGTWMFFLILLATVLALGGYGYGQKNRLGLLQVKTKAWETIAEKRKSLTSQLAGLRGEQARSKEACELLTVKDPLPPGLLPLLDALDKSMPEFTRVTRIEQMPNGGFEVRGHTAVQFRLKELLDSLAADMAASGHSVVLSSQKQIEGTMENEFIFAVGSSTGGAP